jgi:hypothetical protein
MLVLKIKQDSEDEEDEEDDPESRMGGGAGVPPEPSLDKMAG